MRKLPKLTPTILFLLQSHFVLVPRLVGTATAAEVEDEGEAEEPGAEVELEWSEEGRAE